MNGHQLIHISNLRAGYGSKEVLSIDELSLGTGLHVILGPNGAGKTTLFRVLAGVLPPLAGTVHILGKDPYKEPLAKAKVGYLPHRTGFFDGTRVIDELCFWARYMRSPRGACRQQLEAFKEKLELEPLLHMRVESLSRGQKQLVMLARALIHDPCVIILDEPTTGLDPEKARLTRNFIKQLSTQKIILYSTHNLYEAKELATHVIFLNKGRIAYTGSLSKIQEREDRPRIFRIRVSNPEKVKSWLSALVHAGLLVEEKGGLLYVSGIAEKEVAGLLRQLLEYGVEVVEVCEEGNPLEEAFLQLAEGNHA